jgi:predicted nucleotidyltransferase
VHRTEDIHRELAAMKPFLEAEYHVAELAIFGSYARAAQTEESDLDVLVEFDQPIGLLDLVRLENELGDRLGVDVDLVTRNSLKPRVEARITDDIMYV